MGILQSIYNSATGKTLQIHLPQLWPNDRHDFAIFLAIEINKAIANYGNANNPSIRVSMSIYKSTLSFNPDDNDLTVLVMSNIIGAILTGLVQDNISIIKKNPNIEGIFAKKAADTFDRIVAHCGKVYGLPAGKREEKLVEICLEYTKIKDFADFWHSLKLKTQTENKIYESRTYGETCVGGDISIEGKMESMQSEPLNQTPPLKSQSEASHIDSHPNKSWSFLLPAIILGVIISFIGRYDHSARMTVKNRVEGRQNIGKSRGVFAPGEVVQPVNSEKPFSSEKFFTNIEINGQQFCLPYPLTSFVRLNYPPDPILGFRIKASYRTSGDPVPSYVYSISEPSELEDIDIVSNVKFFPLFSERMKEDIDKLNLSDMPSIYDGKAIILEYNNEFFTTAIGAHTQISNINVMLDTVESYFVQNNRLIKMTVFRSGWKHNPNDALEKLVAWRSAFVSINGTLKMCDPGGE